jgi:hypothetical protein
MPPQTIRVLRTSGPVAGSVQTVPFRQYVTTVLTPEWSVGPVDVMRIGAIAVKEYAWYWTMVWRGKKAADGSCYDVIDSTQDQLYRPERDAVNQTLAAAVDATWTVSFRKNGRLFATGYRAGSSVACGADANGTILYQSSLYRCGRSGMIFDEMVHRYLDPVEIARPGAGDSTGDGLGDVAVVTSGGDATQVRLYTAGRVTAPPTAVTTAFGVPVALPLAPAQTVFRAVADMTNDHLDDLLILQRAGDDRYQVWVAPSVGDGFGAPMLWWDSLGSGITIEPGALVRFAAGDFTGDGLADAALLVAGPPGSPPAAGPTPTPSPLPTPTETPTPTAVIGAPTAPTPTSSAGPGPTAPSATAPTATAPTATPPPTLAASASLWVLAGTGSSLEPASMTWSGPLSLDGTTVFAGDVDASGRADLVVQVDRARQETGVSGLRYVVVHAGAAPGSVPETWLDVSDIAASAGRTVIADINGDGRADLVSDRALGTGSQFVGLISSGRAFTQRTLWSNRTSFRLSSSRIASADVDGDGRGDIVVLYNAGAAGSRLYRFLSTGNSLRSAGSTTDATLPWAGAAPY